VKTNLGSLFIFRKGYSNIILPWCLMNLVAHFHAFFPKSRANVVAAMFSINYCVDWP